MDPPGAKDRLFVNVNKLVDSIKRDPDLAMIPEEHRASAISATYVASGCDYTSFSAGVGESTFFKSLFRHAGFIYGTGEGLHEPAASSFSTFLRLIAAAYYTRHRNAFHLSLQDLFASISNGGPTHSQHLSFVNELRKTIWPRTVSEEESLPSCSALQLHWNRCCWVLQVWAQASSPSMNIPDPTEHGWCLDESGAIDVKRDNQESIAAVQALVESLTSRCTCKTGCSTTRCRCKKAERHCSVGCRCKNCTNSERGNGAPTGQPSDRQTPPDNCSCSSSSSESGDSDHDN